MHHTPRDSSCCAANFTRAERDTLRRLADEARATCRVIFVTTPEAVARERWLANRQHPTRSDVRDEDFQLVIDLFELPTPDEDVLLFDGQIAPQDWLFQHPELAV